MTTDYSRIYDDICDNHDGYQIASRSPGYRLCLMNSDRVRMLGKRHLDIGCGQGFAVELLRENFFNKDSQGVDISTRMIEEARARTGLGCFHVMETNTLPFEADSFDLITCFDVLEHLDEPDILRMRNEAFRVIAPGGTVFFNISLRKAGSDDIFGNNLHRTVKPADWWQNIFHFDEYTVFRVENEMNGWRTMS